MSFVEISVIFFWFAIILLIILNYSLVKLTVSFLKNLRVSNADLHNEELKIGEKVPLFREIDQLGRTVKLVDNQEELTLLLFSSKSCGMCKDVLMGLSSLDIENMKVIVISERDDLSEYYQQNVSYIKSRQIFENYKIKTVPSAMILNKEQYLLYEFKPVTFEGFKIHINNFIQKKKIV